MKYLKYLKTEDEYEELMKTNDLKILICKIGEINGIRYHCTFDRFRAKDGSFIALDGPFYVPKD